MLPVLTSDFSQTLVFFETTIRYLGSMLSAYELNGRTDQALLENASRLGDKLMYSFTADGPIPYGSLHFVNNTAIRPLDGTVRFVCWPFYVSHPFR